MERYDHCVNLLEIEKTLHQTSDSNIHLINTGNLHMDLNNIITRCCQKNVR
jgi:hypothetical protein